MTRHRRRSPAGVSADVLANMVTAAHPGPAKLTPPPLSRSGNRQFGDGDRVTELPGKHVQAVLVSSPRLVPVIATAQRQPVCRRPCSATVDSRD